MVAATRQVVAEMKAILESRSPRGRLAFGRAERDEAGKGLPGGGKFDSQSRDPVFRIPTAPRKIADPCVFPARSRPISPGNFRPRHDYI